MSPRTAAPVILFTATALTLSACTGGTGTETTTDTHNVAIESVAAPKITQDGWAFRECLEDFTATANSVSTPPDQIVDLEYPEFIVNERANTVVSFDVALIFHIPAHEDEVYIMSLLCETSTEGTRDSIKVLQSDVLNTRHISE